MDILRSLLGMLFLLLVAYLLSNNRRAVSGRTMIAALLTQFAIGALVLFVPSGRTALAGAANGVNRVLDMGNHGIAFVFGGLVDARMFQLFGDGGFVFGLRVLPMIIFVTALISVLYYIGVMKWIVAILGAGLAKVLGVSRIEACSAVATIFLGQSEMPALVKPFVRNMTSAEIFTVMASGMASVAGSVLVGYAGLGVKMEYLLAASFMAVPGGLLFGKLLFPTVEPSRIVVD
ncbi:MAG: NupC/NupG family nucleoside CNT transporter, partial [Burkholderia sp.]|nr:NupC/NupG family nucleoside CNT transporter [Burkholderia sp.]